MRKTKLFQECDVVPGNIVMVPSRYTIVDMPTPHGQGPMHLLTLKPNTISNLSAVWKPFQSPVKKVFFLQF